MPIAVQTQVKLKLIVTRSHTFSRTLCQLHVITWSFDWFTGLSVSFVIGSESDHFGFGFTIIENCSKTDNVTLTMLIITRCHCYLVNMLLFHMLLC